MEKFKICFVSGKLGDVDGVSLEVDKWIEILHGQGHTIYAVSGSFSSPLKLVEPENCLELPSIRFDSEEQRYFEKMVFPHLSKHPPHLSLERKVSLLEELVEKGSEIASRIYEFIQKKGIDVLIGENTNAMPMSLLAGAAVHKLATEKRMAVIFHHHDFWWERSRFSQNHIESFLNQIMPPIDLGVEHVVISSYAEHILRSIKRVVPHVVYNCEDFDNPPVRDEYNSHFREDFGFSDDDLLFVQPTRVVPRKRIEDSIELVARYRERFREDTPRVHFIISLYDGDETDKSYMESLRGLADRRGVPLHFVADRIESVRREDREAGRIYTNRDVLVNADLVTYLPVWEGFGNALLEAVAAKVPIVTTTYLVYKTDIKMCGFRNIEIRDHYSPDGELIITEKNLSDMNRVLNNKKLRQEMVDNNFRIASREFGYKMLRKKLEGILSVYGDEIRASARRLSKSKKNYYV